MTVSRPAPGTHSITVTFPVGMPTAALEKIMVLAAQGHTRAATDSDSTLVTVTRIRPGTDVAAFGVTHVRRRHWRPGRHRQP